MCNLETSNFFRKQIISGAIFDPDESASDKVMSFAVHCVCKVVSCNFKTKQQ